MHEKRGNVEIQFNWIFVLIAGSIILAFFFVVINQQVKGNDIETSTEISSRMQTLLKNAKLDSGSSDSIQAPDTIIEYKDCYSGFSIGNTRLPITETFGPNLIKSEREKILWWSLPWGMPRDSPFYVTNLLFLSSPEVRYIFIVNNNEKFVDGFYESKEDTSMPSTFTKEEYDIAQYNTIQDKGTYKVRLIFFDDPISINNKVPTNLRNTDVTAVYIASGDYTSSRVVTYYRRKGSMLEKDSSSTPPTSSYVLGRSSVFAAIFAENREMYECGMSKAIERYEIVRQTYYKIIHDYRSDSSLPSECTFGVATEAAYPTAEPALNKQISDYSTNKAFPIISATMADLKLAARQAATNTCPFIY